METLAAIVSKDRVGVFNARFSPKDGPSGSHPSHSGSLEKTDGCIVACVGNADNLGHRRVLEEKRDRLLHRLGSQPLSLKARSHGEAQLRRHAVRRDADSDVADEPVRRAIGDCQLHPGAAREQRGSTHFLDEGRRLLIALCRPALIERDGFVAPVRLERRQISDAQTPQDDSGATLGRGSCVTDSKRADVRARPKVRRRSSHSRR